MSDEYLNEAIGASLDEATGVVSADRLVSALKSIAHPGLHVEDIDFCTRALRSQRLIRINQTDVHERIDSEGFLVHRTTQDLWQTISLPAMCDTITQLIAHDIPPVFAFVFDEYWMAYVRLRPLLESILRDPGYLFLPDFWVWHVEASKSEGGWSLHRDSGSRALLNDGQAGAISVWIPLTPVSSDIGTIMLLPKNRDPNYGTDLVSLDGCDVRDIRVLPGEPGDAMIWSQAILHWGSRGSIFSSETRVSMSMGVQHSQLSPVNTPLLRADMVPSVALRLEMIAKQLLQYGQSGSVPDEWRKFAKHILASRLSGIVYEIPEQWKITV
jgi:hypothetical protein